MDNGRSTVLAALVLGLAVLGGSALVKSGLERGAEEIRVSLAAIQEAVERGASANPAPRRAGPDPNRRHRIDLAGAPARGPAGAAVKLVEFSDFQ